MLRALALIAALVIALTVPGRAAPNDVVRMGLNPAVLAYLPVLIAIDRGYFTRQHIDLRVTDNPGSAMVQLPLLARGDLDVAPMVMAPAFLNQLAQGFNVKLIAAGQGSHAGWNDNSWIVVRQDDWDNGTIRKPADLHGKVVDGLTVGGPPNMLIKSLFAASGLTSADMTYSEKLKGAADELAALRNHAFDVVASYEPIASVLQVQHVAHKWISVHDVIPWLQETFLAASGPFLRDHPDVAARFLAAYLEGARDLARSNGHWTPALLAIESKYSQIPVADLAEVAGPAYVDPLGAINSISIDRQQEFYLSEHLIQRPVAFADMVDTGPLFAARRALAKAMQRR